MLAVARECETYEIALARGIVVAQTVVGKIVQLIGAEIENGDRLARAALLGAVSLIEQRGVTAVWAERDGRGKAVGAGEVAGDGEGQAFAGRKIDAARAVGGACYYEHGEKRGQSEEGDDVEFFHEWPRKVCTTRTADRANLGGRGIPAAFGGDRSFQ